MYRAYAWKGTTNTPMIHNIHTKNNHQISRRTATHSYPVNSAWATNISRECRWRLIPAGNNIWWPLSVRSKQKHPWKAVGGYRIQPRESGEKRL